MSVANEINERLNDPLVLPERNSPLGKLMSEAADEIERLNRALQGVVAAHKAVQSEPMIAAVEYAQILLEEISRKGGSND